jgi:hypothetical protein
MEMNIKAKTAIILLLTFTFGIIIGALLNRALLENRIRRTIRWQNPGGMIHRYDRVIRPNSDQAKIIRNILDKHAKRIAEKRKDFQKEMADELESFRKEISSILTPEQIKRLEDRLFRPPQWMRKPRPRDQRRLMPNRRRNRPPEEPIR